MRHTLDHRCWTWIVQERRPLQGWFNVFEQLDPFLHQLVAAKLWAKPRATGSLVTETIGILSVADRAARVTTAPGANKTATSSRTSSIASALKRSGWLSA